MTYFFKEDITILDEIPYDYLSKDKNFKLQKIQIEVENRDDFDHFTFDSQKFSPYHNDQRVLVSDSNKYKIKEIKSQKL